MCATHGKDLKLVLAFIVFLIPIVLGPLLAEEVQKSEAASRCESQIEEAELTPVSDTIDETARTIVLKGEFVIAPGPARISGATTDPAWQLIDQKSIFQRLAKDNRFAVKFDDASDMLIVMPESDPLTSLARQAVNRAPRWLQKQLEDQFSKMSTAQQDKWANMVLEAVDPYVDEVAFLVAHISKDDLASANFYSQLITDCSQYAYEVDPYLDYVEVRDYGSSSSGGDYYSTLLYNVEMDGTINQVEYQKEFYYWWVISPRGSDEFPTYIDPVPCSSSGTPAAPPQGKFWQRWFFYGATNKFGGLCDNDWDGTNDDPCPVLKDMLAGVPVLWKHLNNTNGVENGAVGVVNDWIRKSLGPFGDTDSCRPVQPVLVYYHNDGNCGEWADLTMAAGRAALIPTEVTGTQVNDHVWNEFYDHQWGRWVQWEPVNNMINSNYSGWWGGKIAATHTYRGDGYGHTEMTAQHGPSATLTVTIYDTNHYPVDGAEVTLSSEYDPLPIVLMSASKGHTDAQGKIVFTIGDSRNYYVKVSTTWGKYPASGSALVVSNAVGGTSYAWSPPNFSGSVPRLSGSIDTTTGPSDSHLIEIEATIAEGYVHGTSFAGNFWYTKDHPGDLDFFIVDEPNWSLFTSGSPFQAFDLSLDDTAQNDSLIPPESGNYYAVWSDKATMDMAHVVDGTVRLYSNTGQVPPVTQLRVGKDIELASLLDWEDVSGQNVDGYNVYRSTSAANVGEGKNQTELAPYLLASTTVSDYKDTEVPAAGTCFYYSVRTHSKYGGISP